MKGHVKLVKLFRPRSIVDWFDYCRQRERTRERRQTIGRYNLEGGTNQPNQPQGGGGGDGFGRIFSTGGGACREGRGRDPGRSLRRSHGGGQHLRKKGEDQESSSPPPPPSKPLRRTDKAEAPRDVLETVRQKEEEEEGGVAPEAGSSSHSHSLLEAEEKNKKTIPTL